MHQPSKWQAEAAAMSHVLRTGQMIAALRMQVMDSLSHPALLLVDGVSSIGGLDFQMDAWKVDVAVTGSQKALSLPTGLAVVAASPKVSSVSGNPRTVHDEQCTA